MCYQERNCHFWQGGFEATGNFGALSHIIGKSDTTIHKQLQVTIRDVLFVKPYHLDDITFILDEMAKQVRQQVKCILSEASHYCIIAVNGHVDIQIKSMFLFL